MSEKRFTVHRTIGMLSAFYVNDDWSDKVVIDQIIHKYEADRLCAKLNELADENEQLKQALRELKEIGDYQADRIKELQKFEDKVFDSLNDKIKGGEKAIEWGESIGADVGAMGFHIELLKQFKKELKE